MATNAAQETHTRDEFFGNGSRAFFPVMGGHREDQIVRAGHIRAIELALGQNPELAPKPIVTYWIITGRKQEDPDAFELFVAETPSEVHVLILTRGPRTRRLRLRRAASAWRTCGRRRLRIMSRRSPSMCIRRDTRASSLRSTARAEWIV